MKNRGEETVTLYQKHHLKDDVFPFVFSFVKEEEMMSTSPE